MEYKLEGMAELIRNFEKLGGDMSQALETAARAGALIVQNSAKEKVLFFTGDLRKSLHMETTERSPIRVIVQVGTDKVYAAIQEFGGIIHAKRGPYLIFKTRDGHWVRTESVQIPAHPYLRPGLNENVDKVRDEIREALADVCKAVAG